MAAGNHQCVAAAGKGIPELRNPRYRKIYNDARQRRLQAELAGDVPELPLFSHSPTYQHLFSQGWNSVTGQDIRLAQVAGMSGERARVHIHSILGVPH